MGTTGSKDKLGGSASLGAMGLGTQGGGGGEAQSPELKCAVPTGFRWHHGAQREVYVVGSFSNWQTKIRLTRWLSSRSVAQTLLDITIDMFAVCLQSISPAFRLNCSILCTGKYHRTEHSQSHVVEASLSS